MSVTEYVREVGKRKEGPLLSSAVSLPPAESMLLERMLSL